MGEPRWHRQEREQRERELYPELKLSDAETVFEVDKLRRQAGRQPTSLGRATEDTLVRTYVASDTYQSRERELRARPNPRGYGGSPDEFLNRYGDLFDPNAPINNLGQYGNPATSQFMIDRMGMGLGETARDRTDDALRQGIMADRAYRADLDSPGPISRAVGAVAEGFRQTQPGYEFPVGAGGQTVRPSYQPTPGNILKSVDTPILPGAPGILDEFTRPSTIVGAAVPALSFASRASFPTRLAAEGIASGVGREAQEEVYDRTEGLPEPARVGLSALVGIGSGVGAGATVGGLGSIAEQGVKQLGDDAVEASIRAAEGPLEASTRAGLRPPKPGETESAFRVREANEAIARAGVAEVPVEDAMWVAPNGKGYRSGSEHAILAERAGYVPEGTVTGGLIDPRNPWPVDIMLQQGWVRRAGAGSLDVWDVSQPDMMASLTRAVRSDADTMGHQGEMFITEASSGRYWRIPARSVGNKFDVEGYMQRIPAQDGYAPSAPREVKTLLQRQPQPSPGAVDPVIPGVTPRGRALAGRGGTFTPAESARAKLIDALTEERRLRTTGLATREIREGRRAQYAAIDSARDAAVREGLEGDALQRSLESAARTGTLRRTFPKLELDDAEFTTLIRQLNEAPKDIASGYDAISLGRALSDWRQGVRPPQPKQIQAIGRILGGEVKGLADDLAREARDYAQDQGMIQRLRELYDRLEARQTAQAGRQAEREAARAVDTRIRELGDLEGVRIPRPNETTLRRALEDVKFADDPQGVRRAQKIVAAYEADQMKAAAEVAADLQKQADIIVQMERLQARAISRADDVAQRQAAREATAEASEATAVGRTAAREQRQVRLGQRDVARRQQREIDRIQRMNNLSARAAGRDETAGLRETRQAERAAQREARNVARANRAEQRVVRQAQRSYPTRDLVLERVAERIRKTAEGADPVSDEVVRQAQEVADVWVTQNRALLDRVNEGGTFNPFARMTATIRGDVQDPFINAAMVRESLLSSNLQRTGVPVEDAKKIARLALDSELMQHYNVASPKAVPAAVRDTIREARNIPYDASVGGIQRLNREAKSTMFGLADAGIFGQQVPAALRYGGIPAFTGYVNRLLGMLQLPHVQTIMSDINLPKQMQYAMDGLDTSIKSSGLELGSGTLLRRIPKVGETIDSFVSPMVDWWSSFQFDTVFGNLRQAIYEGELISLKLQGSDITDPLVRSRAADYANHITSSSRLATNATRRAVEELTFTSPSMTRARAARINDMANLIKTTSSREEKVMAASMVMSMAAYHAIVGGVIHTLYGVGDFEIDPSKPGFGKITTRFLDPEGNNYIVDFIPQDAIDRAFFQSMRVLTTELADNPTEGLDELAKIWARVGISGASPVARLPLAGAGFSFDRSSGYNIGRYPYSSGNFLIQSLPIPPVVNNLISGETKNIAEGAAEVLAVPLYPESGFGEVNRRADDLFGDSFEDLDPIEIRTILAGMDKESRDEARSYVRNVVKEQVAETGFDEIETGAWEAVRNLYPGAAEDFEAFRTEREAALEPLYANSPDVDAAVDKAFNALPIVRAYRERLKNEREQWVRENAESGLANLAVDYNFIDSNERIRAILSVLSPARTGASEPGQ